MELIGVLLLILLTVIFLKILGVIFHAGIFVLALPIKLLAMGLAGLVFGLVLLPLGIVAGLASLIVLPVVLIGPILPILLLGGGLYLLLKNR